jgi:PKD repeat protein
MKRGLLLIAMLISFSTIFAQVPRNQVVVEVGTSTLCPYCPGAAMGIEDLISNGWPVAPLEHHSNLLGTDPYSNTYSLARCSFYNINALPMAFFDGLSPIVGGFSNQSMYTYYYPKVQARMDIPSPLTIEAWGTHSGLNYNVTIRLHKVTEITGSNIKLHLAITESNIFYVWENQSELNYVNRLMVPDQNGTLLDFSDSIIVVPLTFSLNPGWAYLNLDLDAFVQNMQTKEILQGYKVKLAFLAPPPPPAAAAFTAVDTAVCQNSSVQFTDESTGSIVEWYWTFPGGTPETSREKDPLITYGTPGKYDVTLTVSDGVDDSTITKTDFITVNTLPEVTFGAIEDQCINYPAFMLTQGSPEGGTYSGPGVVDNTFDPALAGTGTHTLTYTVTGENGCVNSADQTVVVDACTGVPENNGILINALPNPTSGLFRLSLTGMEQSVSLKIVNSAGEVVFAKNNIQIDHTYTTTIDLSEFSGGIYYIYVEGNRNSYFRKIILQR